MIALAEHMLNLPCSARERKGRGTHISGLLQPVQLLVEEGEEVAFLPTPFSK